MPDIDSKSFRLGDWVVEPDLNQLSSQSGSVRVEPKTMALLVYLSTRPGEVVSADEIIAEVWGGRPMGDNPVYKSMAKLRKALGDESGEPRYIATVSKKGYRLIAAITDAGSGAVSTATTGTRRGFAVIAAVAGFLLALLVAIFYSPEPGPVSVTVTLATDLPGSSRAPSWGPDGERFAFISDADGRPHIWIQESDGTEPRQLTFGARADFRPRWSPDGRTVLFHRGGNLWTVPAKGGDPSELIRDAYNPNWSHDGGRIVFERDYQVWTSDADGGNQLPLPGVSQPELALSPRSPAFSPDGTKIVYFESGETPHGDLWTIPLSGGVAKRLTSAPALGGAPVWTADGKHIIYSSQRAGSRTLWRVDAESGNAEPVLVSSGDDDFADVSIDGRRIIYSNTREHYSLIMTDAASGEDTTLYESRLMMFGPELSPDGGTIAFFGAALGGGTQIYVMPAVDGLPTPLSRDPFDNNALPRWSADGQDIFFYRTREDTEYSKFNLAEGTTRVVATGWNWNGANGVSIDADGDRAVFSRLVGQAPVQTIIHDFASGNKQTFYATLEYPRWSSDGEFILGAITVNGAFPGDVGICPVDGPECRILAEDARIPVWSPDEKLVYFLRGFGTSLRLYVIPADGSEPERLVKRLSPSHVLGPFYTVTKAGNVIWVRHDSEPGEIWIAEHSR